MLIWRVIGGPGGTLGVLAVGQRPGAGARGDGEWGGRRGARHTPKTRGDPGPYPTSETRGEGRRS
jgi:hypothetical protein